MKSKNLALAIALTSAMVLSNYAFATESVTGTATDGEERTTVESSTGHNTAQSSASTNEAAATPGADTSEAPANETTTNSHVRTLEASTEHQGIELNETNFPDESFRYLVGYYDADNDGRLSNQEIENLTSLSISPVSNSTNSIDLTGIQYLTNLSHLSLLGNLEITKGLRELEQLPALFLLDIRHTRFAEGFSTLRLNNLKQLSIDGKENRLSDVTNMVNLQSLSVQTLTESSLEPLTSLPKLEQFSAAVGIELDSIDLSKEHPSLKALELFNTNINNLKGLEKYKALERISITGGSISDISQIMRLKGETLANVSITGQSVETNRQYSANTPYTADDIKLLDTMEVNITSPDATVNGREIVWSENAVQAYEISATLDSPLISIQYQSEVVNIFPETAGEGGWVPAKAGKFKEVFEKDKIPVTAIRQLTGTDSLFSTIFRVNDKPYTYAYAYGSNSTATVYKVENGVSSSFGPGRAAETYVKKEGDHYLLKTISFYNVGPNKKLKKEEISYIQDGGVVHEVSYTNVSTEAITDLTMHQMLDTMLNENDAIPIYADGRGNAYIVSDDFTLFLEKLGNTGTIISGRYFSGPLSDTAKNVSDYARGDLLLDNADTAIYYGTDLLNLAPNETYRYSYKETVHVESPVIKAEDKVIRAGETWSPLDQLIGIFNANGVELDKSKVVVSHEADPNTPGVYEITFIYNNVFSKTVTLTVVTNDTESEQAPKNPVQNTTVKNAKKEAHRSPKTADTANFPLYMTGLFLGAGAIFKLKGSKK